MCDDGVREWRLNIESRDSNGAVSGGRSESIAKVRWKSLTGMG